MTKHKISLICLGIINVLNLAAGIAAQIGIITGGDVTSVIPITVDMTVIQILLLNSSALSIIITLISIVTTYLVTDVPYSPKEILSNCAGIFMIIPVIILGMAIYNSFGTTETIDKISIIISAVVYVLLNAINFGCVLTIKEDSE